MADSEFAKTLPPELEIDVDQYPIVWRFVEIANPTKYKDCLQDNACCIPGCGSGIWSGYSSSQSSCSAVQSGPSKVFAGGF